MVSILVPVYNGADMVERCLDSLLKLDYPTFEIWVLDDRSSDDTVSRVCSSFPKVNVYRNPKHKGFGASLNNGVKLCRGEIIALVNVDAWVDSQWLRRLVDVLVSDPKIALVGSKILEPDGKTLQHAGAWVEPSGFTQHFGRGEVDHGQYDILKECEYVCAAAVAFKRDLFEQVGGFDPRFQPIYFEDVDLAWRLRGKNYQVLYVPAAIVWHLENVTWGKGSRKYFYRYNRSRIQFIYKWLIKQNGVRKQLRLEWESFRKPWPFSIRLCWIGAFLTASCRSFFHKISASKDDFKKKESMIQQDLRYINEFYDLLKCEYYPLAETPHNMKKHLWRYWVRRFVGRVIGYYLVRQRDFNLALARLMNDSSQRLNQLEDQYLRVIDRTDQLNHEITELKDLQEKNTEQLSQLVGQIRKLQRLQESLLTYLCESLGEGFKNGEAK